ncbi:MAG TPA: ABC transporter permease [Candidatus Mediterraneibacter excrementavium]|nr:ABC transporter permease [Candidatus Mediterraneibacter excrementavium]
MLLFEIRKIFSRFKNRFAALLLLIVLGITSILAVNKVEYVDENGNSTTGITAAANLRAVREPWSGYLTEEVLKKAVEENNAVNASTEANSTDIQEQNKAFAKKQGFEEIRNVINEAFSGWRDYDYYAVDSVSPDEAGTVYERRISQLKGFLDSGEEYFSEAEKEYLISHFEDLETPFYYESVTGWDVLLQDISTFILILALFIGFFISGIFSDEFQTKADAIFFSAKFGRSRAAGAKIGAGFLITTVFYVVFIFLYTMIVLGVTGFQGAGCPIQLTLWRSVYNITYFQAYLLIVGAGYVGTLFAGALAMLCSAVTRSTAAAVVVPFIILCAFPFLSRIITLPQICSFFPDQLMEVYLHIKDFDLVEIGGKVMSVATLIIPVYAAVSLLLQPVVYLVYRKSEVRN